MQRCRLRIPRMGRHGHGSSWPYLLPGPTTDRWDRASFILFLAVHGSVQDRLIAEARALEVLGIHTPQTRARALSQLRRHMGDRAWRVRLLLSQPDAESAEAVLRRLAGTQRPATVLAQFTTHLAWRHTESVPVRIRGKPVRIHIDRHFLAA